MPRQNTTGGSSGLGSTNTSPPILHPLQDPSSPYYIHPNENTAIALVNPPLIGTRNYHGWTRMMKKAIITKNKIHFIDGSLPPPDRFDPLHDAWVKCNNLVHSWFVNSVSFSIAQSILFIENAYDVWKDLRERFAQGDSVRVAELQQELYTFKQGSLCVTDFFTELKILWEELDSYRPMPQCTCAVRCICESMRNARKYKEDDCVIRFLNGLNEPFAMVKSQILMMEPLPPLNRAFSLVVQFERQHGLIAEEDDGQVMVNAVDTRKSYGRGRSTSNSKICTHCGKIGHTVDTCYRKHGFPPGFKFKNGNIVVAAAAGSEELPDKHDEVTHCTNTLVSAPSITPDEYKTLISLLKSANMKTQPEASINNACTVSGSFAAGLLDEGFVQEDDWFG